MLFLLFCFGFILWGPIMLLGYTIILFTTDWYIENPDRLERFVRIWCPGCLLGGFLTGVASALSGWLP